MLLRTIYFYGRYFHWPIIWYLIRVNSLQFQLILNFIWNSAAKIKCLRNTKFNQCNWFNYKSIKKIFPIAKAFANNDSSVLGQPQSVCESDSGLACLFSIEGENGRHIELDSSPQRREVVFKVAGVYRKIGCVRSTKLRSITE